MWFRRLRGGPAEPAAPDPKPRGFAEAPTRWVPPAPPPDAPDDPGYAQRAPVPPPDRGDVPFPSTGPIGHRSRMRDRLLDRGPDSLADYEMLEMLLFFAFKTGDTKPLAKSLINRYGSFAAVLSTPAAQLMATRGLGPHSVAAIKLVQSAALRLARAEAAEKPVLNNWDRLMDYLHAVMARERVEQFRILFLDTKNRLLADEAQARGTVNHTPVYPREVVKRALELHATALLLVHNHPSGDPTPSREDIEMTAEVKKAAGVLSIVVHDHVIIGNGRVFSFRREGLL
ncbi:RadC family protein [Roseomonas fluvialis]|uniref:DNA repair protein RadC n=1 Tax=Roseomonas fluvialis TaxID=1750527 RepID=A0ABM7Y412_9PROT|nr:DNA repair protein RadC [Roseomonas fluvialis]BDG72596.1 DNA repair protein RadC [Roseomonas fluvialis]